MQNLTRGHATPVRVGPATASNLAGRGGSGVGWIDHVAPFHLSAKGRTNATSTALGAVDPTAVQLTADGHDTAPRRMSCPPAMRCLDHRSPFHLAAVGSDGTLFPGPQDPNAGPTAVHAVAVAQDTASMKSPSTDGGPVFNDQLRPSHRAEYIRNGTAPSPTPTHAVAVLHDTDSRSCAPGFRVADHRDPFQRAAREPPTARHERSDVHETDSSSLSVGGTR